MDTAPRFVGDSPPPFPVPAPIFPQMPSATAKNMTRALALVSVLLTGVGGWYAKDVETDPEDAAKISQVVNVPGLLTAASGIVGIVGTLFLNKQHTDQAQAAVNHVETVKAVEVAKAAAAPPAGPDGEQSVALTLRSALTQASQRGQFPVAQKVLDLLKDLNETPSPRSLTDAHLEGAA